MRVLITGITGMIGTHLAEATRAKRWETFGIARNSASSRLASAPDRTIMRCDILDRDALEEVFTQVKPDIVVHLAAQAFNSTSWKFEESTMETNYIGTRNVLRCCQRCPPAKV